MVIRAMLMAVALHQASPAGRTDSTLLAPRVARVAPAETLAVFAQGLAHRAPERHLTRQQRRRRAGAGHGAAAPGPIGSAYSMRHITEALAERRIPTVVIDPLGMGASSRPQRADYTLAGQARRIAAVLDTLHVDRFVIVAAGNSATIAFNLAADQPSRVAAVLSLAGGPIEHQGTKLIRMALLFSPLLDNAIGRSIGRRKFVGTVRDQSLSDAWCTKEVVRAYLADFEHNMRGSLRAVRAMSEAVEPAPIASRLPHIQAPVRLLVGSKRTSASPADEQIALLQRALPHFRVDTVASSGALMNEERADAVVLAILDLLRVADGGSAR